MIAICHIRQQPHYRRSAFEQGLRATGYRLVQSGTPAGPDDLFIIWNRYAHFDAMATAWERHGGTVLVAENGYIGADPDGRQYYAIAAGGHNGSGWWPIGNEKRFERLGIDVKPFINRPGYALVCGQRGIGSKTMASPPNWHATADAKLRAAGVQTKVRLHPGNHAPAIPLSDDLAGAASCVIWSSGSGVKALVSGVPVMYDAPHWICEGTASKFARFPHFDQPTDEQRAAALERMAWAQWSVSEIESGEPFARFRDAIAKKAAA